MPEMSDEVMNILIKFAFDKMLDTRKEAVPLINPEKQSPDT